MTALRILHVLEATTAGVRRYVTELLAHRPGGWTVEVACPLIRATHFGDVAFAEDVNQLGVLLHPIPMRRSIGLSDIDAYRALTRVIRAERFDIIHTHSSKAGFLGRLAAKRAGVPVIHTPNGLYFIEQVGLRRRFYLWLERLAGGWTTRLIAVSGGERVVMLRHKLAAPERICLIENGVDAARVRALAGAGNVSLPGGSGPLVGGVGRMVPQKDPLTFVRAASIVSEAMPSARFVWCGDGELRPAVESLARGLNVPLRVTGHLENVWAAMRGFDVFALPSLYEGLPFTLLEAMALGIPAVASDVVGTHDVLNDDSAGWRVPARDPGALAQAVLDALARPAEARRRASAAARLVETRFSIQRMIDAHTALYEDVLQTSGSA